MTSQTNEKNETIFILTIKDCKFEDSGQYIAKIKNPLGEVTTQTKLNVLYGPKFMKELASEYIVKEHDTAKFSAEILSNPQSDIYWSKEVNNENININSDEKFKFDQQKNVSSLIIKDSILRDTGDYICTAKNKINEVQSKTKLIVTIPPKFLIQPDATKDVELGKNEEFKCLVKGFPLPEIKLFDSKNQIEKISKDGEIIIKSIVLNEMESETSFIFNNINSDTPCFYEIKAINKSGEANCKFNLNITRKPEFVQKPNELIPLVETTELILNVVLLASPEAALTWTKDNNKITTSKRIQIIEDKSKGPGPKSHTLKIASVTKEDLGTYEILATNKLGEAKCTSNVNIEYGPSIIKDLKSKERGTDGYEFILECSLKANPQPEVKWYVIVVLRFFI